MSTKQTVINAALSNAALFLGTNYSQEKRLYIYSGGSMDCSSYVAAMYSSAGYPLLDASGTELRTSTYQVNAVGFDLIYPDTKANIGKKLPSAKGLLASLAQPGDIVFWCFNSATTRKNKITHVGMVDKGGKQIIHTANNRDKCCRVPISYGDGSICAIIRLKEDIALPALAELKKPDGTDRPEEWQVRILQVALNIKAGEKLTVDGIFGSGTEKAVTAFNASKGITGKACTAATRAALGLSNGKDAPVVIPEPENWPVVLKITSPLMRPEGLAQLQDGLTRMGFDCGTADGICGSKTIAGVNAFIAAQKGV